MARGSFAFVVLAASSALVLLGVVSGQSVSTTSFGYDVGTPTETACFGSDTTFQAFSNQLYAGVPVYLFIDPQGGNNCNKSITVTCVGPFPGDNGQPCRTSAQQEVIIVDLVEGPAIVLSNEAFNIISDFAVGRISVNVGGFVLFEPPTPSPSL